MNLEDLLGILRGDILNDRSDRIDGTSDYLWSDETLVRYIDEAQRRFAKQSYVIRDSSTSEVVNVTVREGVTEYTLHPSVLFVISARIDGSMRDLHRMGHVSLGQFTVPNSIPYSPAYESLPAGAPIVYTTDETLGEDDDGVQAAVTLRIYPEPRAEDDGTVIKLRVVRLPIERLTINNLGAYPELPETHHLEMLDWAAYLALRIADHDAGNLKLAADYAASFGNHVREAQKLVLRKLFAPQPWGFGRHGFRWGS